ncbi:hypothetical protein PIROE2DRAFT_58374 [Piromyces sp. E2]|nr:hypothetical protein PIROE2DRAFT_58374 [Piromyces sp. E2]|eukprot:OUM67974.1 hypothetical protein PIROE2DRAFT_58374 [Piromyces sp. E2]
MWISPLNCENFNSWETLKINELFILQKSVAQVGLFWKTLQNVFDTKQPPFRIVLKSSQNEFGQVIAVGNTKEEIEKDWKYIIDNFMPAVEKYEDFDDKESFILYKLGFLLSSDELTQRTMDRLLKATSKLDQVPGLSYNDNSTRSDPTSERNKKPIDVKDLQAQRQNAEFRQLFNLPEEEDLVRRYFI